MRRRLAFHSSSITQCRDVRGVISVISEGVDSPSAAPTMCTVVAILVVLCLANSARADVTKKTELDDVEVFQKIVLPPLLTPRDALRDAQKDDVETVGKTPGSVQLGKYSWNWAPKRIARPGFSNLATGWYDRSNPGNEVPTWGKFIPTIRI
ncbi:hypothetical protein J6590_065766 [Homalodisca vitripennis]|nr:hypothetical protein J6590_065766 [Homalodisca vitripennis]